ncbi:branched-chain amino acid ABC transporter permease [Actinoplanes xinjiangensis]|jgi:neutral amino acid transport system permease protein|uniref:Amino acid/amide ABC transporter membrane protein 2 (HAAT family) n=1 Tax=Actinoplanes xinjiangensis TaxID=512350 RepID=A0A316FNZ4_9ACTN|nr:branched-chain amino acid ABC transporter permease [Actinoplanes xinjiangensis]PWK49822.1 amino acid/amide ABC transporter membrane protein 2 (HAAT family) [Actinoplanes xinjiangensis]GIF37831.1 branched-chain amino acid ABC transporter permease [Actinoplanes xinjiangensis]
MGWDIIIGVSLESLINATMIAYALAAIGLNVHFGYTGLLNFGQSAFLGVAAYGLAMTVATFGLPFWVGIGVGLLGAVILALLLGIPTLRLRADYLAIVTIAAAEIVRLFFRSVSLSEWTGGSDGLQAFSDDFYAMNPYGSALEIGTVISFDARELWVMTVGWVLVAISVLIVFLAMRSPWGRVIKAIREDEDAVRSLGKNVVSYKMQSLILGGVLGSLGGYIIALSKAAVQPDTFGTEFTFYMYTIVILGGAARVFGPVVGSMIFWFLLAFINAVLPAAITAGYIPTWLMTTTQAGAVGYIFVGLGLVLLLIFRPQGIFGDKKEVMLDGR